jgi:large subunit ribosomal protein L12
MEYIYCAMLLHAAGKPITEESIANVLKAAGVEPDAARIKALTAALEGIDIKNVIESTVLPGFATTAPSAQPQPQAQAAEEKKEEKKKEEEKKVSEEEAAAGLSALFG